MNSHNSSNNIKIHSNDFSYAYTQYDGNSINEQNIPKQIPKIFITYASITSFGSKKTNDSSSYVKLNECDGFLDDIIDIEHQSQLQLSEEDENIIEKQNAQKCIQRTSINEYNEISPMKIIIGDEYRTMVLIKNIPLFYKPQTLLNEILSYEYLEGKFNFFYLPYNNKANKNYGFALINFVNALHVVLFYEYFHKRYPKKYRSHSKKIELCFIDYDNNDLNKEAIYKEIILPYKYMGLFKEIYRKAVCVVKDVNLYGEGYFAVKSFGHRKTYIRNTTRVNTLYSNNNNESKCMGYDTLCLINNNNSNLKYSNDSYS